MLAEEVPLAPEQRKLAAILAVDVVGYSRLMGRDESGTLARLQDQMTSSVVGAVGRRRQGAQVAIAERSVPPEVQPLLPG
jgi:class 3 adenylate cyclase